MRTAQIVLLNASVAYQAAMQSVCAFRALLGVDQKILSVMKEPMLSGFVTLNAQNILPHAGNLDVIRQK